MSERHRLVHETHEPAGTVRPTKPPCSDASARFEPAVARSAFVARCCEPTSSEGHRARGRLAPTGSEARRARGRLEPTWPEASLPGGRFEPTSPEAWIGGSRFEPTWPEASRAHRRSEPIDGRSRERRGPARTAASPSDERLGWALAALPATQRGDADAERFGELRGRQPHEALERDDVVAPRDMTARDAKPLRSRHRARSPMPPALGSRRPLARSTRPPRYPAAGPIEMRPAPSSTDAAAGTVHAVRSQTGGKQCARSFVTCAVVWWRARQSDARVARRSTGSAARRRRSAPSSGAASSERLSSAR